MAQLIFKRGSLANLNNLAIKDGQFIVTTDEGALYVDNGSTRVRLGDFIVVENVAALPESANRKAMYYCEAENVLARWNGTEWKQINKQPTTAELKVALGLDAQGVVTAAIAAAKKAGDDAGVAAANAQKDVDALEAYVGAIPDGYTEETVIAYINKKAEETLNAASGGSSESAASVKAALDTEIARAKAAEEANAKAAADAQTAADNAQTTADGKTTMAEVEAKGYATKEEAKGYADAKNDAIAAAQKAGGDAQADVDALELKVGTVAEGKTVVGLISDAQTAADNAQDAVDTLASKVGTVPSDKTVVQMISDAQTAATYDDEEVRGLISDNADAIDAIEKDYLKAADKEALQGNIDTVSGKVTTLIGDDANKSVRTIANEELAKQLIAEGAAESLDTLQEIATWIQSHPDDASAMNAAIEALEAKVVLGTYVEGEDTKEYATVKAYVEAAIAALQIGDYAKAADLTDLAGRVEALETASATHALKTEVEAVSDALDEYKTAHTGDYTNAQIDAAIDADVKVVADELKAYKEAHASDFTNEEITNAIANAGHASASDLATHTGNGDIHVTAEDKANWNGIQAAAKDYTDAQIADAKTDASNKDAVVLSEAQKAVAAAKTELQGNIDTVSGAIAKINGDVNTDGSFAKADAAVLADAKAYSDEKLESALEWGEF